jgi:hypothetical protein
MRNFAMMVCCLIGVFVGMVGSAIAQSPIFAPDSPWANYGFVPDDYDTKIDAELGFHFVVSLATRFESVRLRTTVDNTPQHGSTHW